MKKLLTITMLCLIFTGGCLESFALIGGGAAGGMTIARILEQQQQVIRDDITMMEAQRAELEQQLAEATDEAEKEKIRERLKDTDIVLADLKDADEALERAKEGMGVNWQDPQSVIPFAGAVLMTVFGIWQRRKKKEAEEKEVRTYAALTEVVAGGEAFKKEASAEGIVTFKEAHRTAQKSLETKKMVAVIKA